MRKIHKLFLVAFLVIPNQHAIAQVDLKLDCRLNITTNFNTGRVSREIKNVIVEVLQYKEFLGIFPDEVNLSPVDTKTYPYTKLIKNSSNENKWELKNINSTPNSSIFEVTISIDRNNGLLNYYSNFDNAKILTNVNGYCDKIDASKKKF